MRTLQIFPQALGLLSILGSLAEAGDRSDPSRGKHEERNTNYAVKPYSIGILLYPGWEPLDVFGPMELFFSMSYSNNMSLSIIAHKIGPITTRPPPHVMTPGMPPLNFGHVIAASIYATHTFANAPELDIIFVPGGMGNMALDQNNDTSLEDFVAKRYKNTKYILSVCTGAVTLAKAGILKGRRATTNKSFWAWVTAYGKDIEWVPSARWVVDGKIWTSSGVAAGLDMTYAFLKHLYGEAAVNPQINSIEYAPHTDKDWDPFSVIFKVPGADTTRPLKDCIGPVA